MTQRAIKQVLTERYYSWRDAEVIAKDDPEINLSGNGPAYTPTDLVEDDVLEENMPEAVFESDVQLGVKAEDKSAPNP
jgi:large subunit ribosomal protein L47